VCGFISKHFLGMIRAVTVFKKRWINKMSAKQNSLFTYQLLSQLVNIGALRSAFSHWCKSLAIPENVAADLVLVLDELITNIVEYGYHGLANGRIDLSARLEQHCVILTLRDYAFAFNPCEFPAANIAESVETRRIGGLGIHFVREKTTHMSYQRLSIDGHPANQLEIRKCWANDGPVERPSSS
jgi:anti-sigma regulatory factor (Ser/Thr protein kinase)